MNIIIVGAAYPFRGGIAHHTALLYRELSKRHHVQIVTFKRQYPAFLFPGKSQLDSDDMIQVPTEQLIDSMNPLNWISVGRAIRRRHPDLLIVTYSLPFFGPCYGTIVRAATRKTRTKVLFLCHNIIPHEKRPGDAQFTRCALSTADYFIVQSDSVERDLKSLFPDARYKRIHHPVYNVFGEPVDKQLARRELHLDDDRIILFFGYIRAYKGLRVLLDAMPAILRQLDLRLLVVGEFYDDKQKYVEQIGRLGIDRHVTLVADYVPNEIVAKYFSAADVAVLPYRSATQSGIAQIAYNFDKPVIATNVGGLGEIVRDGVTGFVVPPDNAERLSDAVLRFYHERREHEFAANVRIEKQKYSWENMRNAIESLMQ